jgi:hypothetical protein
MESSMYDDQSPLLLLHDGDQLKRQFHHKKLAKQGAKAPFRLKSMVPRDFH